MPNFDGAHHEAMDLEHVQTPPKFDGARQESMDLECEKVFSVDFNKEVGSAMDLEYSSAHASSARIVARVRKRPYSSAQKGALSRKKLKAFVTDNKGKVIATGFHNEQPVYN